MTVVRRSSRPTNSAKGLAPSKLLFLLEFAHNSQCKLGRRLIFLNDIGVFKVSMNIKTLCFDKIDLDR